MGIGNVTDGDALENLRMHLHIGLGTLSTPLKSIRLSGRCLVADCLRGIDFERHPPRLFVLWATKKFFPFEELLSGIYDGLEAEADKLNGGVLRDVPLIGSSVAACMFHEDVHPDGALLLCFASRFIQAEVAVGENAHDNPTFGVATLLRRLNLQSLDRRNPRGNRFMIAFLPGVADDKKQECSRAYDITAQLATQTNRELPMFGGVSSVGFDKGEGSQFFERNVYTKSIVGASLTSDLTYCIGLNHGLTGTDKRCIATSIGEDGRTILKLNHRPPIEVVKELLESRDIDTPWVFGHRDETMPEAHTIHVPQIRGDVIYLAHELESGTELEIRIPESRRMQTSVRETEDWLLRTYHVQQRQLSCFLRIGCTGRYEFRKETGFDPRLSLKIAKRRLPHAVHAGCYMDGELGIDRFGNPGLAAWSVSTAMFADNIPPRSDLFLGFDAISQHMQSATLAPSVSAAMDRCLQTVKSAGFSGAMISLVQDDADGELIVAHAAFGKGWHGIVMPQTRRPLGHANGEHLDILAIVANGKAEFVRNAQLDHRCRKDIAVDANVVSFYAAPLRAEADLAIGVLQVDLGDIRDTKELPVEQQAVLNALGDMTAAALNRAIRTEELDLLRKLDHALIQCMDAMTPEDAISAYAIRAADSMSEHAAEQSPEKERLEVAVHIRLHHADDDKLWLIDGRGPYYKAMRECELRIAIPASDPSSSTGRALRNEQRVVNNADLDQRTIDLIHQCDGTTVADALRAIGSYADFPIGEIGSPPIGTVSFSTPQEWFFSQARLRSLVDVGQRMSLLLTNIRRQVNVRFLANVVPPLAGDLHLYRSFADHMPDLKNATGAERISCFLWDDMRDRFILRAQLGWHDENWVNAAWHEKNVGMTGSLATTSNARHIDDLIEYNREFHSDDTQEWLQQMFDGGLQQDETCEVIVFPLKFRSRCIGILTLHRRRKRSTGPSVTGFATTDLELLSEASEALSAYAYAAQDHDHLRWRERELKRQDQLGEILRNAIDQPELVLLQTVCNSVVDVYRTLQCNIYVSDQKTSTLHLLAWKSRMPAESPPQDAFTVDAKEDVRILALGGKPKEERTGVALDNGDPEQVALENIVQGVAIPMTEADAVFGVLYLKWKGQRNMQHPTILAHHDLDELKEIGRRVSIALHRNRTRLQRRRSENALNAMSYFLFLGFHAFTNGVQAMQSTLNMLDDPADGQIPEIVNNGNTVIDGMSHVLKKAQHLGDMLATPEQKRWLLPKLLTDVLATYGAESSVKELISDDDASAGMAYIDMWQIRECFNNLINNSIREVRRIEDERGRVTLQLSRDSGRKLWRVYIDDNGPGLSREAFERHVRGRKTERNRQSDLIESRGMGLFLCPLFCEGNGGTLEHIKGDGAGTRLCVSLPFLGQETQR